MRQSALRAGLLAALLVGMVVAAEAVRAAEQTWAFDPDRDEFSEKSLLDLRSLNEREAGQTGWLKINGSGDFVKGDGSPIRIWAVNGNVSRGNHNRPRWKEKNPDLARHARWLAKKGVNMTRCHAHINPGKGQKPTDVNMAECEWIWRTVAAMKKEGIYTIVSPYWNTGGDLFYNPETQRNYKAWLRTLFLTRTPLLGGKTLAQEPGLGIFQIQNEDSLLFWTVGGGTNRTLLCRQFAQWAVGKYGSIEAAYKAWGGHKEDGDDPANGILALVNIWHATIGAKRENNKQTPRVTDQVQFFTETMYAFNRMVEKFVREELRCPVLINAGNWKTACNVLLNDAERYSYTANEVLAVNRYFGGIHTGKNRGWAIINGDEYASDSALTNAALKMPLNLKLTRGHPMMITEGSWVFPNEYAAEAPFLVSVYSSLTGFDAYYWFATGTETWTPPQSANGYLPSQQKWICMTPDMAALWPAAALSFRLGYVARGEPVLVEHRALPSIYRRKSPMIAESATFDPNQDAGDQPAASKFDSGVSPYAFLAGPVEVVYDSSERNTVVHPKLESLIRDSGDGKIVTSVTGQVVFNTDVGFCAVNAPQCQGVAAHFASRSDFNLADVSISAGNDFGSVMVVSLDGKPIRSSDRVLVQVGMQCRPTGWKTRPVTIRPEGGQPVEGKQVVDYGSDPWQVECPQVKIRVRNSGLSKAVVLDLDGVPRGEMSLNGGAFTFPSDAIHVVLQ